MDPQATRWVCATRALKNARFLQKAAPHVLPEVEPAQGFGSLVPLPILANLQHLDRSAALAREDAHLAELLKGIQVPAVSQFANAPLFSGTLYFVQLFFVVQSQGNAVFSIPHPDMETMIQYANLATSPISHYAEQYGQNSVGVHPSIITFQVQLPTPEYNDSLLRDVVSTIVNQLHLPSSSCLVLPNPPGVVNTDGNPAKGIGGYHSSVDVPYIFLNIRGPNLTLDDRTFSYAGHLSHEIAEMVVDPAADDSNPEVCDPCGPNCASTFLDYFDSNGNYIATSQDFPPRFSYGFYINGIVRPSAALECPPADPVAACSYGPVDRFAVTTDAAPASAGRASNLFVFIKTLDGRVLFNQQAPGSVFVGWQEVPGGLTTDAALAAGMQDQTLVVFAKLSDGRIAFNQAARGKAFVGWQEMPGGIITDVPLASAGRQSNLFVFAKTLDGRILFNQAAPGQAFVGWQEAPGGARTKLALGAGMQDQTLFVFATRPDGRLIYNQAPRGGAFVNWRY